MPSPFEVEIEESGPDSQEVSGYDEPSYVHIDDDVVAYDGVPSEAVVLDAHDVVEPHEHGGHDEHEVFVEGDEEYHDPDQEFELPLLPGCKDGDDALEVSDQNSVEIEEAPKKAPKNKWDMPNFPGLEQWMIELTRPGSIPSYGRNKEDLLKLRLAIRHLERVVEISSKEVENDTDQVLNIDKICGMIGKIETAIDAMKELESKMTNEKKKRKKSASLVAEGQKAAHVGGIIVTVPLLISRVARVCINGAVSAGHDIEVIFEKQAKQYDLSERECAEVMQLLSDMGYPLRSDRGYLIDEKRDDDKAADWAKNFKG